MPDFYDHVGFCFVCLFFILGAEYHSERPTAAYINAACMKTHSWGHIITGV